ncbi:hypothetical protein AB2L28_05900 [Kineococcus sp. TBRC 1896]|uniref:Uncharacterized protein n=1 Tax=Kineococcus mangrovi TaxID=1660183 RepID=A0ABV4HZC1_9ACTN
MEEWIRCPSENASLQELDSFGVSFNAYERIADSPERLLQVVRPVVRALDADKPIPSWAQVDLLRAALFYVHRRGHWQGPSPQLERHFRRLVERIGELTRGQPLRRDTF